MHKQLIFIDDSGDPGFKENTTSKIFLMAAVVFNSLDLVVETNNKIDKYRKQLGWKESREFKFRKISKQIKRDFIKCVQFCDFEIYAVYIEKSKYGTDFKFAKSNPLYSWAIKELLKIIPLKQARIKIDGESGRKYRLHLKSYLRKNINMYQNSIRSLKVKDSRDDNLIQLADVVAGAINRSFQLNKTDARDYIKLFADKIVEIKELNLKD